jgi:hypothetical protein
MAKGGKLVHPAQPDEESLNHIELGCPFILLLSIDNETLRSPSEQRSAHYDGAIGFRVQAVADDDYLETSTKAVLTG